MRRLIIIVLVLLMVLPAITFSVSDNSYVYGLENLFWFGRSSCTASNDIFCKEKGWMTEAGWEETLRQFVTASRSNEREAPDKSVLWIHVPDWTD